MSQASSFLLDVDYLDNGVSSDERGFVLYDGPYANRSKYICTSATAADVHALDNRHQVEFYRSPAKRNGNYRGTNRTTIKLTKDVAVDNVAGDGQIVAPLIWTISAAIPLGVSAADIENFRMETLAMLGETAVTSDLFILQEL